MPEVDRWQPDVIHVEEEAPLLAEDGMHHESKSSRGNQLKVPRSRLFQSALGGIKQQQQHPKGGKEESESIRERGSERHKRPKADPNRKNGHFETERSDPHRPPATDRAHPPPVQQESNILDRIRKPDGSAFEEWELRRDSLAAPRGKKRQAEEPESTAVENPAEISEVESLKLKIARLEKEVQSVQAPPPAAMAYYPLSIPVGPPPPRPPSHDFDRKSVCVKNVHFLANAEVVAAHFHSCSPIVDIQFAKDAFGRPKGFCFVQFAYEQCVSRALELDQSLLLGRKISVVRKLARPPAPSPAKASIGGPQQQWSAGNAKPAPATVKKEEWNQGSSAATPVQPETDINDFAIDTGSQELL